VADQVREVRRFVASTLATWQLQSDDVALLVSELATNAVLHARSEFEVSLTAEPDRVRVEVSDGNSRVPSLAAVPVDAYSGRGLLLVQQLAQAWGVETAARVGKTIWFEVALAAAAGD
jgi:anti-sigma regulatory factor (Ser/Thr protein kinase)